MSSIVITTRAIIIHEGKLLMCRQDSSHEYFHCLPGGKLDPGETIEHGLTRELIEETGVTPELGNLLYVNQLINDQNHRIEFFYLIKNAADYAHFDPTKATHAFEIGAFVWGDPTDPTHNFLPTFLRDRFANIVAHGPELPSTIVTSS